VTAQPGLHIVGAGGFGREVLDALLAGGDTAAGFLDDAALGSVRGLGVRPVETSVEDAIVAVAHTATRRRLAEQRVRARCWRTVRHPTSVVSPDTSIGEGSVLLALSFVSSSVTLGRHVHVNYHVSVGHDATVGDYVTLLPGCRLGGWVQVGDGVMVGSNATVLQGLTIGEGAVVGAGAVVTHSVPPGQTVVGVPARPLA
jgi:sugar O-acyltransferase (sialic acid O-acetyltransferase NeuD family)